MFITKIKINSLRILFFLVLIPNANDVFADNLNLSLTTYLKQVQQNNMGMAGNALMASGARQRTGEGKLIIRPSFFAEGQYLKNNYNPNWSPIVGNSNRLQTYKVGVSQTTPYGLQGKLYYNYQHQTINGLSPLVNQTEATASSPILELELPLARNLAGRETRATAALVDSQARLNHFSERYQNKMLMAQAESAYWRLAALRNIVAKNRESLGRYIKIQHWVENRVRNRLAEDSDLLQAQASVDAKKLDIQSAINDEKIAALNFNTLRGSDQENVPETLTSFNKQVLFNLYLPDQPLLRDDVRAAEEQQKIEIANAKLGIEKNKPDLSLYASYAFNGNNPSSNEAIAESFTTNYPSTAIGLRLTTPLDFGRLQRNRNGYKKEIKGAQYQYQQKVFENQRLYTNLIFKLENAKKRYRFATQLEQIQLKKLQTENQRLVYGKTTTYQVLLFEQDYTNAQIATLSIQDEILELIAQLKTFGE